MCTKRAVHLVFSCITIHTRASSLHTSSKLVFRKLLQFGQGHLGVARSKRCHARALEIHSRNNGAVFSRSIGEQGFLPPMMLLFDGVENECIDKRSARIRKVNGTQRTLKRKDTICTLPSVWDHESSNRCLSKRQCQGYGRTERCDQRETTKRSVQRLASCL